ncbi:toll/interleukin-1 receptor domain-containing protein [Aquincola sp. S2]|uniref:Toll/interleukin-1 receptor domain-containing protein n=1 Tax=Pseudaquabacterium terrae TaxID=2732868 RepID=A0ABX2EUV7_9BURK|nr:toll/interleukin-1 receptor domain-containing protein [Aquabacterium terrae]NRF72451.1 toll/interleukin-1 receptor domain-containing protein [Aquabacterium terrae]
MVQFATFDDLERFTKNLQNSGQVLAKSLRREGKTVFLSHSHKDNEYLPGVISVLENNGGSVYVDVQDKSLPEDPSLETAAILRQSLSVCRKFVVFVTTQSKDSKWIPWELGLGDGEKTMRNVALFPAAKQDYDQAWAEREYLGLYDRIVWGQFTGGPFEWLVHHHHDNTAVKLNEWLTRT